MRRIRLKLTRSDEQKESKNNCCINFHPDLRMWGEGSEDRSIYREFLCHHSVNVHLFLSFIRLITSVIDYQLYCSVVQSVLSNYAQTSWYNLIETVVRHCDLLSFTEIFFLISLYGKQSTPWNPTINFDESYGDRHPLWHGLSFSSFASHSS